MQVNTNWRVLKFGGTSVASRAMWDNIFQITQAHLMEEQRESQRGDQQQRRVLLVCSAPSGVSNQLENLIEAAIKNDFTERFNQLRFQFEKLAQDLELSVTDETVQKAFDELWQYLVGVAALGEASPRSRAKIMAFGEMTLTQIAHQYLIHHRQACRFLDARTVLRAETVLNTSMHDQFLNAHCSYQADQTLQDMLNQGQERLVITQGFIAANSLGETVLLGRGGSDTSAAYFAAKMNAECLEIWTDVPGVYTANPAVIPEARLISELTYLEAQELASMGAKIMHPRCIEPVAKNNIPLWIKYTLDPSRHGTKIHNSGRIITGIKGVITKSGLVVLSIETLAMWHQVGFLADVFACFKKHGVSIDLISTSETMITVSLDQPQYAKTPALLDPVLHDLRAIQHAKVTCLTPCASISIVGQAIRACLSEFADVFELFKEQRIYLLSQAANDLNLSLIVDDEQAPRLAAQIHRELIERRMQPAIFKAAWREEFFSQSESRSDEKIWWMHEKNNLLALASKTPCYVYSKKMIADAANRLITQIPSVNRWWYAIKANSHPDVLTILADYDFGFECVSVGELERVFATLPSLDPSRVLFTPNFAPLAEYQRAFELGVHVTLDNLAVLREHGEIFSNRELILRVDLGQGHGHHRYVVTGGDQSKFGMAIADLPQAASLARQHGVRIKGLHTHAGSGIRDAGHWGRVLRQ
jgi:diaminopimelate decarboxylase/aspartate kinase